MAEENVPSAPRKASPALTLWLRMGAAHFAAYPVAFAAAMAGVPLAMLVLGDAVLTAPPEKAAQRLILEFCLAFAGLVYALVHLVAIPWARGAAALVRQAPGAAARARKGRAVFVAAMLLLSGVCVVGGLVG